MVTLRGHRVIISANTKRQIFFAVLHILPVVLVGKICLNIKAFSGVLSFDLFDFKQVVIL